MYACMYIYFINHTLHIYNKLDLNTQVTYIYCASNIYLKFFLCATTSRKWHIYEIVTLVNYLFNNT